MIQWPQQEGQHGAAWQPQDEAVHDPDSSAVVVVLVVVVVVFELVAAVSVTAVVVVVFGVVAVVSVTAVVGVGVSAVVAGVVVVALEQVVFDGDQVFCFASGPAFSSLPHRGSPPRSKSTKFRSVS